MSTFLVPLNDLETGQEAVALGRQIASALGAELGLILTNSIGAGDDTTLTIGSFVLNPEPDQALLSWIESLDQPVIVLETLARSHGGLLVSDWISNNAGPSVTSLAGSVELTDGRLTRLLIPLDGSAGAEQILTLAATIALRNGATLGLVRVIEDRACNEEDDEEHQLRVQAERLEARIYLDYIATRIRAHNIPVTWEVRIGNPGDEIARAAETTAADLVLMASHHYAGANAGHTPSVTARAVAAANVPIIIARINAG